MKNWERKFITHPKIETITQSNTTKYVYLLKYIYWNVLELGIKYLNFLPGKILMWPYHSKTSAIKTNFQNQSMGYGLYLMFKFVKQNEYTKVYSIFPKILQILLQTTYSLITRAWCLSDTEWWWTWWAWRPWSPSSALPKTTWLVESCLKERP